MADAAARLSEHIELTSEIVGAYVARNHVSPTEMATLIRSVHDTLADLGKPAHVEVPTAPPMPPVPVRKSVTDEYLGSLEDGKRYQSLNRHLSKRSLTPTEYRAKWHLPADYPMVAPAYARKRSKLAKEIGLGKMRKASAAVPRPAPVIEAEAPTPSSSLKAKQV